MCGSIRPLKTKLFTDEKGRNEDIQLRGDYR